LVVFAKVLCPWAGARSIFLRRGQEGAAVGGAKKKGQGGKAGIIPPRWGPT